MSFIPISVEMSLSGQSENPYTSARFCSLKCVRINELVSEDNFDKAATEIEKFSNGDFAETILSLVTKSNSVVCWIAFLKNIRLNEVIDFNYLNYLVTLRRPQITFVIAQNPSWCKMLGYSSFLKDIRKNEILSGYIIDSENFLRNLEPYHIAVLLEKCPHYRQETLNSIFRLVMGDDEGKKWAIGTFKWLLLNNINIFATNKVASDEYHDIYELIRFEFNNDRNFVMSVLMNRRVCRLLGQPEPIEAFPHPLLSQDDFRFLGEYYRAVCPALSKQYFELAEPDPALLEVLSITSPTYLIAREATKETEETSIRDSVEKGRAFQID